MGFLKSIVKHVTDFIYLRKYYLTKKDNYISDIIVPVWKARLTEEDIGDYRIKLDLGNGHTATVMVVHVEEYGFFCQNVHLNIEFIDDLDYMVHYKFFDFVRDYGSTLIYLLDNGGVVNINEIYNI